MGKDIECQGFSFIAGGNKKWYSHFEDSLEVTKKKKSEHNPTIWSGSHILQHLSKLVENLNPQKNLHTDVYRSFIHNLKKMEATKMSFSRWMGKQTGCRHTMEYYPLVKKNWPSPK